jgi:small subunit ribosomal protein S13
MLIIFGKKISEKKKIRYALTDLYGIGKNKANIICDALNLPQNLTVTNLTENQKLKLSKYIKQNLKVESQLNKQIKDNINKYITNKSIRGFRHRNKLPVRGQRTHTNAKTCRKFLS